jgi:hypothetical protein
VSGNQSKQLFIIALSEISQSHLKRDNCRINDVTVSKTVGRLEPAPLSGLNDSKSQ